jgi:hypothetical protein
MKMEQSDVPKLLHTKFRSRAITQKKEYNINNRRKFEIRISYKVFNRSGTKEEMATPFDQE